MKKLLHLLYWRPTTVSGLLRRAFVTLIVLTALAGLIGVFAGVPMYLRNRDQLADLLKIRVAGGQVRAILATGQITMESYLLTGDPRYQAAYTAARGQYPAAVQALHQAAGPESAAVVDELDNRAQQWWSAADELMATPPGTMPDVDQVNETVGRFGLLGTGLTAIDASISLRLADLVRTNDRLYLSLAIGLAGVIVFNVGAIALIGRVTSRRITVPLGHVIEVLDELAAGNKEARVRFAKAPDEISAVGRAVNGAADKADHERRLFDEFRRKSVEVRRHLSGTEAATTAAQGIGELLEADHVVIRPAEEEHALPAPEIWSSPEAVGDPALLARTPVDWLEPDDSAPFAVDEVPAGGDIPPEHERVALRAAGAGPVITLAFGERDRPIGDVTAIRHSGRAGWMPTDVQFVHMLAGDLGRALTHAELFAHERELVTQLQQLDKAKTEFLSNVSHELRTPMTSVSGYVEVLLEQDAGPLNAQQERMLKVIDRNVSRLRLLIEDLLLVSRIESGKFQLARESVDLADVVTGVQQTLTLTADKGEVALDCRVERPLPLHADPTQLDRMIINLVSNAVKFTPQGGTVTVTARAEGPDAVLVVRDTGIGIPAADLPNLFTRFFRAHNATEKAIPGTGLGLSIVSTIVEHHGGTIDVDSTEDVGTTMTVRLPLSRPDGEA